MLFSNPLIEVSLIELLKLWGELVEAYHGKNGFGGCVAEIYAYRFTRYSPLAHTPPVTPLGEEELQIINLKAGNALVALVEEFCNQYSCKATIDTLDLGVWCRQMNAGMFRFDHRARVEIIAIEAE